MKLQDDLSRRPSFLVGEWQSQATEMPMRELRNVSFAMPIPPTASSLATMTGAHLPWAEDHFEERVSGEPLNPAPSEAWWPFAQKKSGDTNSDHKSEGKSFSHTYPERMWPKFANIPWHDAAEHDPLRDVELVRDQPHRGIRFEYGDLGDVSRQLAATPHTRQAFLPLWFPEDTGAVHGKRVPCTLGYHFAIRHGRLDITYYMRSTDLLRHFQDDIYLAGRLAHWMVDAIQLLEPKMQLQVGELIFHTANLHIFEGDLPMIKYRQSQGLAWNE